ncbi:MAG: formylglycine-generating enzyme family protein [Elusimicrobia bacterium]|nr:formylglycine-generating enzyme family protein [Elusimicrobiota bacterium]
MTRRLTAFFIVFMGLASMGFTSSSDQVAGDVRGLFQQPGNSGSMPVIFVTQITGGPDVLKPTDALDETKVGVAAKFIPIPAGEFKMGSPTDEIGRDNNETQHPVKLTKAFEIQATEVTQLQYFLVMGSTPSHFRKQENCDDGSYKIFFGFSLCANHPVERVSWYQAQEFINELNRIQNKYTYRLPSEAEWEYAARANRRSSFPYSFGFNYTDELDHYGWHWGNSKKRTHAMATGKPSFWDGDSSKPLFDMHGNVWEWTQDVYDKDYGSKDLKVLAIDPTGRAAGWFRVLRGGSWHSNASDLRSARRTGDPGHHLYPDVGFRLARTLR